MNVNSILLNYFSLGTLQAIYALFFIYYLHRTLSTLTVPYSWRDVKQNAQNNLWKMIIPAFFYKTAINMMQKEDFASEICVLCTYMVREFENAKLY